MCQLLQRSSQSISARCLARSRNSLPVTRPARRGVRGRLRISRDLAEAVDLRPECAPGPVDSPFAAEDLPTCQSQRRRHKGSIEGTREVGIVYLSETLCRCKVGSKKRKRNEETIKEEVMKTSISVTSETIERGNVPRDHNPGMRLKLNKTVTSSWFAP